MTNHTTHQPQSKRQPREGKGRNGQAAPPPKKKRGGGSRGAGKQPTASKPPANDTEGGQTPHPEGTKDRTPKQLQGDHPAKTGNTKPGTAANREKGHRNKQTKKKKKKPAAQPERKETGGETTRPGTERPSNRKNKKKNKQKSAKNGPSTHAHTAHRNRKRWGAREKRTKPHTTRKQADTKAQPRTPQTAGKRGTTPQTEPKHTHPRPQPQRAGVNKTHDQPQPGPNHKRKPTVGNPVPTARALRQPVPCR